VYVAYRLGRDTRDQLIGQAADPELSRRIRALLDAQPEIDSVEALLTMQLGLESTLVAARIDLVPGLASEEVEDVAVRIKRSVAHTLPGGRPGLPRHHRRPDPQGRAPQGHTRKPRRDGGARRGLTHGCPVRGGSCARIPKNLGADDEENLGDDSERHVSARTPPVSPSPPSQPVGSSTKTGISRSVFFW